MSARAHTHTLTFLHVQAPTHTPRHGMGKIPPPPPGRSLCHGLDLHIETPWFATIAAFCRFHIQAHVHTHATTSRQQEYMSASRPNQQHTPRALHGNAAATYAAAWKATLELQYTKAMPRSNACHYWDITDTGCMLPGPWPLVAIQRRQLHSALPVWSRHASSWHPHTAHCAHSGTPAGACILCHHLDASALATVPPHFPLPWFDSRSSIATKKGGRQYQLSG